MKSSSNLATLIERYFTDRLMRQRDVSSNTTASYRDTFRLLFTFAQARLRKPPSALVLEDLDAAFVNAFLHDLEKKRGASIRTRNLRLTAIRSFFRFVSFEEPARSALIQRVLAIPSKGHDKREVHFLTRPEIEAILAVPDRTTWLGRRDHTLLLLAVQTGLRLSELIGLDRDHIHLGAGAHVPVYWQRAEGAVYAVDQARARCAQGMAQVTDATRHRGIVPQRARGPAQR
jgi:integrase/recombinase XerD